VCYIGNKKMTIGTQQSAEQTSFNLNTSEFTSDPQDWYAAKLVIDEIDEEMRLQREALLMRLAQWLIAHNIFRKVEKRKMIREEPGVRDLNYHDTLASSLMGTGKLLIMDLRQHDDVDTKHLGIRFEDFLAIVTAIERDHAQWHSGQTEERSEQILKDVFGE